ncbi:MAG: hypothetical protein KDA89_01900, partial [Planctomycetaceae bacterium]|nr:hypothetical protein [Planctomycetaceae bacterium]
SRWSLTNMRAPCALLSPLESNWGGSISNRNSAFPDHTSRPVAMRRRLAGFAVTSGGCLEQSKIHVAQHVICRNFRGRLFAFFEELRKGRKNIVAEVGVRRVMDYCWDN